MESASPDTPPPRTLRPWLVLVILSILITCTYANCVRNDFVFDDLLRIKYEPSIRSLENIPGMLDIFDRSYRYRPMRTISYALDYALSGLDPLAYHISNLVYHTLCSFLVFLLVRSATGKARAALFASLLFAVHPVQTEAVSYLSGRRDLLATLFYLLSAWLYFEYRGRRRHWFIPLIAIALGLGVLSKETVLVAPGIFLLYDAMREIHEGPRRLSLPRAVLEAVKKHLLLYLPLITAGTGIILFLILYRHISSNVGPYGGTIHTHLMLIPRIMAEYFRLMLLPFPLCADYSYNTLPIPRSPMDASFILSLIAICAILWATLYLVKKDFSLGLFMGWFLLNILPVSQIIPHHELMAEHHLYLPSVGLAAFTGVILDRVSLRSVGARKSVVIVLVLLVALFSVMSVNRNRVWRDSTTLWSETIRTSPNCARAHYNLGTICFERGDLDCAAAELEEAIRIKPGYERYNKRIWLLFTRAHDNLGLVYNAKGKPDLAIEQFKEGLRINFGTTPPDDPGRRVFANLHNNLGKVYMEGRLFDQAEIEFRKALKINPGLWHTQNNLGVLYTTLGRPDLAEKCFISALQIEPVDEEAFRNLAFLYGAKNPGDKAQPHCALGHRLLDAGLNDLASRELATCLALDPDNHEERRLLESLTH
ncbi:tetratricopeptide repeat protein [Thermodesulfobacteriota bacterium]